MNFYNYLIQPYLGYTSLQIGLELIATFTGILSVYYSIKKNILVFPIGLISTVLYTYLLFQWGLYGDMGINAYYSVMSVYGWWSWKIMNDDLLTTNNMLKVTDSKLKLGLFFSISFAITLLVYLYKFKSFSVIPIINYVDSFITATFLVAMYLLAKKRIENWHFWILGNTLAIPLFIVKGYGITAFQYFSFLIMAFVGLIEWRKNYTRN